MTTWSESMTPMASWSRATAPRQTCTPGDQTPVGVSEDSRTAEKKGDDADSVDQDDSLAGQTPDLSSSASFQKEKQREENEKCEQAIAVQATMPGTAVATQAAAAAAAEGTGFAEQEKQLSGPEKKGIRFWLIIASLMVVALLPAIDMTIISTALPTITQDLPTSSVSPIWVTSAFLLTTTTFQPVMGALADVFGRRAALVVAVVLFLAGSVIAAVCQSMLVLVIGRAIQGIGGGGITALGEIIISDITTLLERGMYMGFLSLIFALASFIAPVLGGAFSQSNWRWIFWLNLPIAGVALILIIITMSKLQRPAVHWKQRMHRMDLPANLLLLASCIAVLVGVTDGGLTHPWSSYKIIVPLVLGVAGLAAFFVIEFTKNPLAKDPVLPLRLFKHPTALASLLFTFLHGVVVYGEVYILPLYFQAIKDASPIHSAVDVFPATVPGPVAAIVAGIIMSMTGKYRFQIIFSWLVTTLGCGLLILLDVDTPKWKWVIFQLLPGFGIGSLFSLTLPPIQATNSPKDLAYVTAAYAFMRSFGSVWGIAMGTDIFVGRSNILLERIDEAAGGVLTSKFGLTGKTALGLAPEIHKILSPELLGPVRGAYMSALRSAFIAFVPLAGAGLLLSLVIKDIPLPNYNLSDHGLMRTESARSSRTAVDANERA